MKRNRWIALLLAMALTLGAWPGTALAEDRTGDKESDKVSVYSDSYPKTETTAPAQADPEPGTIDPPPNGEVTGFPNSGPLVELWLDQGNRPSLEGLLAQLPSGLTVLLDGEEQVLPVSWFCVGEDFETGDSFYYQFSPMWDESRWSMGAGLDVLNDAPYVAVFLYDVDLTTQDANQVELQCYQFFVTKMGLNTAAACGILANIYNECSFKPNNLQQSYEKSLVFTDESYTEAVDKGTYTNFVHDSAGYGLVQFTWWTLKRDLLAYAKKKGTSIGDVQTQLEFLQISLGATRTKALQAFPNTAQGAYDAGKYFCDEYEKPGLKDQPIARANLAKNTFWPKYKDAAAQAETGVSDALAAPVLTGIKNTAQGVQFTWDGVVGAAKYRVYRKESGGSWSKLTDTEQFSLTDKTAQSGKTWVYTVRCLNSKGKLVSGYDTDGLSINYWAAPELNAPKNTDGGVALKWSGTPDCPLYLLYRREPGGKWGPPIQQLTGTSFTDETAEPGKQYQYTVRCADENGNPLSAYRVSGVFRRLELVQAIRITNATSGIKASWNAVSGAEGYKVYRRTAKEKWKCVTSLKGAKQLSWTDKAVRNKNGTAYWYVVRAVSGTSLSGYEEPSAALYRLTAPKLTKVSAPKKKTLKASWKKNGKAQGYELLWQQGAVQERAVITGSGKLSRTVTGLAKGKASVRVRAWRKAGANTCYSAWSAAKTVKIK